MGAALNLTSKVPRVSGRILELVCIGARHVGALLIEVLKIYGDANDPGAST